MSSQFPSVFILCMMFYGMEYPVASAGQLSCLCLLPSSCGPSAFSLAGHEKLKSPWLTQGKSYLATTRISVCHHHYFHTKSKITSWYQLGRRKILAKTRTIRRDDILQRDMDKLQEWDSKKKMKFKVEECEVPHLGWHKQGAQYRQWCGVGEQPCCKGSDDPDGQVRVPLQ